MALIIGTNAYISLTSFRAWALLRGIDLDTYTDAAIEAAVVVSSLDFIDTNYTFLGKADSPTQPMNLPTDAVTISDVESPVAHTVYQQLTGNLFIDPSTVPNSEVTEQSRTLGPLTTSTKFREGSRLTYTKSTRKIDQLFQKFALRSGFGLEILRG